MTCEARACPLCERLGVKISVVTPCFNSQSTLRETIESVLAQKDPDFEHVVMDGGSTDGTLAILQAYPHLRWLSEKDEGHYDAMNRGIARATGDLVVILNADDCFREGALSAVRAGFAGHPDWDGCFGDFLYVDGEGREIFRRAEALYDFKVLLYGLDYICHHTMFIRRAVYDRLGGYRHREFRNAADFEFKLRLGRAGCRIGHVPQFLVNYRIHAQGQAADWRIIRNSAREAGVIRREYGNPGGLLGRILQVCYKAKRQFQKLRYRGRCDLVPGTWHLRKHRQARTQFSSNVGLDNLES